MSKDKYMEPKVIQYPSAVVKVYSPILTDEERKKRMASISEAAKKLLISKETNNGGYYEKHA